MAGCIFILCKNRRKNTSTSLLLYVIFMIFILFLQQTILYEYKKTKERNFTRNFFTIPQFYSLTFTSFYIYCVHTALPIIDQLMELWRFLGFNIFRNFIEIGVRP